MTYAAMENGIRPTAGRINTWLLPLLAMSLPLSTSAVTVLAFLVFVVWLIEGQFRTKLLEICTNSVSIAVLIYLALLVVGMLWTQDTAAGLHVLQDQWKLLLMPVFLTVVLPEHRRRNIYFYLAGLSVAMLLTYLAWFDLYHYGGVTPQHLTRKVFHVVYNPMLAFGFYLVMHEILWGGLSKGKRVGLLLLAAAMVLDMFITEGRAGQIAFFALLGLLVLQYFKKNRVRGLLVAALAIPLLFALCYSLSPTFQQRLNLAWHEAATFNLNPDTSIGLRLLFWQNSWEIVSHNPFFGVGTGDFARTYATINARRSPGMVATDNPHNQYVLVLCQLGILGLASLLSIFIVQIRQAFTFEDGFQGMRLALPVLFLLIMLSDRYLCVYETGFLFSLFSAVLYRNPGDLSAPSLVHTVDPGKGQ